jgi:hypothetical protein
MNEEFKKGVSVGLTIYLVFAVIAIVTHLITGWDYPHGPPISFGVIMIAAVVGMIRFFTNLWRITSDNKKDRAKGEMLVHAGLFGLILVAFLSLSHM